MLHKYSQRTRILNQLRAGLIGGSCLGLVSCAMHQDQKNYVEEVRNSHKSPLASLNANKKIPPSVAQAIGLMKDHQFQEASSFINQALQNDPQSIPLHLLNAMAYEKLAEVGDSSRIDLAAVGYQNALNLDPNNVFAMTQLGKIKFKHKQYDQAQELFANALLVKPNDASLLQELAASSYYAYDAKTALAAIDQAVKVEPQNPLAQRSAAMIHAALGDTKTAKRHQSEYQKLSKNDPDNNKIASRLEDWDSLYKSGRIKLAAATTTPPSPPSPPPSPLSNTQNTASSQLDPSNNQTTPQPDLSSGDDQSDQTSAHIDPDYGITAVTSPPTNQGGGSGTPGGDATNALANPPATGDQSGGTATPNAAQNEQVIIDCYLLSISESATTSKGQNLLENLKVTLNPASWTKTLMNAKGSIFANDVGSNATTSNSYNSGSLADPGVAASNSAAAISGAATGVGPTLNAVDAGKMNVSTFSSGISWAGLTYNLNIANAVESRSEVIGRPTLHAFKNSQAVFYSGDELVTGLSGVQTSTLVRYPLGTTLFVTVDDIQNDEVTLSISIEGSLNTNPEANIQNSTLTIAKTRIDTKAKMLLGETLMLGGIYTNVNLDENNGVPGLKKVPIAQYFFSNEATLNRRTSIVVLLTPRSTDAVKLAVNRAMSRKEGDKVRELFVRHPDWYQPQPNLVKVLKHLSSDPIMYYEFRNSDVLPPHWGWEPSFDYQLDQVLAFAYY